MRNPLSFLELGPLDGSVPSARLHARLVLQAYGFEKGFIERAELLVSELVTNAVHASQALATLVPSPIRLWLEAEGDRVTIIVWDADPRGPVCKTDVPVDAEGGRGLLLVEVMSERWGWTATPDRGGKSVWCIVGPETVE
jgi:anti-sigma regulatory factor (Ser/Thr protein kinase)